MGEEAVRRYGNELDAIQRNEQTKGQEGRGDKPDSIRRNKQTELCADATGQAEPYKKESGEREVFYRIL